jgi:2-polyprenyl-6-hydroxyphenyl methylase/3-demethylubiquinone-9 3-methyltransferase
MTGSHQEQIEGGQRFPFGENWKQFLSRLNENQIEIAKESICTMLELDSMAGRSFLDVGCGSGLFSLAARSLGARVCSFDFDPQSVACANELRRRYFPSDPQWSVAEGSILDEDFVVGLGKYDFVYAWGVLHHTGDMWSALRNAAKPVSPGGVLFVAIYNDQNILSTFWHRVKKIYCTGRLGRYSVLAVFIPWFFMRTLAVGVVKFKNPIRPFTNYSEKRGMSIFNDWLDWLGGYPFEVAKPEQIWRYYRDLRFDLVNFVSTNRLGCNQYVFQKRAEHAC